MSEIVQQDNERALASITESQGFYSSLSLKTRADKMRMLNKINNSTPLVDEAGKTIDIVDVVMQTVEIVKDQDTGEVEGGVRIVLVTADGNAYHATSKGIVQSMRQLFTQIGEPSWSDEPVKANVLEKRGRNGYRFLTLDFVAE